MPLDRLDKFRTGLPVSEGVVQTWGATWLKHQAIRHHLPEIRCKLIKIKQNRHTCTLPGTYIQFNTPTATQYITLVQSQ